jgi:hypothetical protein
MSLKKYFYLFLLLVFSAHIAFAEDIAYKDKDIIRNGDFEDSLVAWFSSACFINSSAVKDGEMGMEISHSTNQQYFFQQLTIPTQLDSATLRFDYRAVHPDEVTYENTFPVDLQVTIAKSDGFDSHDLDNYWLYRILGRTFIPSQRCRYHKVM